jgi:hypothetical protein
MLYCGVLLVNGEEEVTGERTCEEHKNFFLVSINLSDE